MAEFTFPSNTPIVTECALIFPDYVFTFTPLAKPWVAFFLNFDFFGVRGHKKNLKIFGNSFFYPKKMETLAKVASRQLMLYKQKEENANSPNPEKLPFASVDLLPKFTKSESGYTLRWESHDKSWWTEFNCVVKESEESTFKGTNVPLDCELAKCKKTSEEIEFYYGSATKPNFWARITIPCKSPTKKVKVEAKIPILNRLPTKKTKVEYFE